METDAWAFEDVKLLYAALLFYETAHRRNRSSD
jgi:hypothetical protein